MKPDYSAELAFFILWEILIGLEIWRNWYIIEKKHLRPHYLAHNIVRAVVICIVNFAYCQAASLGHPLSLEFGIFQVLAFGSQFDPILNLVRGNPIIYINRTNPGWWDRMLGKLPVQALAMSFWMEFVLSFMAFDVYIAKFSGFVEQWNGTYNWNNWIW